MADLTNRTPGSPARSVFGDIFGFDPLRFVAQPDAFGIDMRRTGTGYEIDLPVPGFRPEEISVSIEDRVLSIEGRGARRRFTRALTLPDDVDEERIEAHVEHGMLTLTLPQTPKTQPRRIAVHVGAPSAESSPAAPSDTAIDGTAETSGT